MNLMKIGKATGLLVLMISVGLAGSFLFSLFCQAKSSNHPDVPKIISRAEWGADESLVSWPPEYATSSQGKILAQEKIIVIHHTATINPMPDDDGSGEYKNVVRSIFRWHLLHAQWHEKNGQEISGFGDIGYHYLIDPNGHIYQGREGKNGVIGAHVSGNNTGAIGIALIGTYGARINGKYISQKITPAMKNSLIKLVAWLAAVNNIDLSRQVQFNGHQVYPLCGHRDLRATQCPGDKAYQILPTIRLAARRMAKNYQKYLYQISGHSEVYQIKNGYQYQYTSLANFRHRFFRPVRIISVSQKFLSHFWPGQTVNFSDGTLIKVKDNSKIYLIDQQRRRLLKVSSSEFKKLGFSQELVKEVSPSQLNFYQLGLPVVCPPENKLFQSEKDRKIYLTKNCRKHWFPSQQTFQYLKYSKEKVKIISGEQLEQYLDGGFVKYPDGTLLKGDGPEIYLIKQGQRKLIPSFQLFQKLGFRSSQIIHISSDEISLYPLSQPVVYPDRTLLKTKNNPTIYLVKNGSLHPIISWTMFQSLGYRLNQVLIIPDREMSFYSRDGFLKYPDGKLIRSQDNPKVYVIKNSQPDWIKSAAEFKKSGYHWSDVIIISPQELAILYPMLVAPPIPKVSLNNQSFSSSTKSAKGSQSGNSTSNSLSGEQKIFSYSKPPLIKIGIWAVPKGKSVLIKANGKVKVIKNGREISSSQITQKTEDGPILKIPWSKSDTYEIQPQDPSTILEIVNYQDYNWNRKINYNQFRGNLIVSYSSYSKKVWVVNQLDLESYLKGVAEALNDDPSEYQKAFAIASRSYALFHLIHHGKRSGEIFTINNTPTDQVYKGYNFEKIASKLSKAVENTYGEVIVYRGKISRAVFSSDSGGVTKNACAVWGGEFCRSEYDYLKGGVKDPDGTKHSLAKIRASHGVGMSCIGARRLARLGKDYRQILQYYFPGIKIERKW